MPTVPASAAALPVKLVPAGTSQSSKRTGWPHLRTFGSEAIELTYKDPVGKVANELLYRYDEPRRCGRTPG